MTDQDTFKLLSDALEDSPKKELSLCVSMPNKYQRLNKKCVRSTTFAGSLDLIMAKTEMFIKNV